MSGGGVTYVNFGDLTQNCDAVGLGDLNLLLEFWDATPERFEILNHVLAYWGVAYPCGPQDSASASASESASAVVPEPTNLCDIPACALDIMQRHEYDNFPGSVVPDPETLQTASLAAVSRSFVVLVERLEDSERFFDLCLYTPDEYVNDLSIEMWYFDTPESIGAPSSGDGEPLQFFARVEGLPQNASAVDQETFRHDVNFEPRVRTTSVAECWSGSRATTPLSGSETTTGAWLTPGECDVVVDFATVYNPDGVSQADQALLDAAGISTGDAALYDIGGGRFGGCRQQSVLCVCPDSSLVTQNPHWVQDPGCSYPIQDVYDDDVTSCLDPTDSNTHRRDVIAVDHAKPSGYDDYSEQLCFWNEIDNSVRIAVGGRSSSIIFPTDGDWSDWPSAAYTAIPSLFASRSCDGYTFTYDCDPDTNSSVDSDTCRTAHPYCSSASLHHWGRIRFDNTAYLNANKYRDETWIGERLTAARSIETVDGVTRTLDSTNTSLSNSIGVIPFVRSVVVERPIQFEETSRTINATLQVQTLVISEVTGRVRLFRRNDGASFVDDDTGGVVAGLELVESTTVDCPSSSESGLDIVRV